MIHLFDASIFVFRGWFALPDSLRTARGEPANGFRGFATALADTLDVVDGHPLILCFDESLTTSFRNEIEPTYKANRELPPPELEAQFQWCRALGETLGLPCLSSDRFEADDLMASVARLARVEGQAVTLISRDKDLAQLLRPGDLYWEGPGKTARSYEEMRSKLGFPPERMADYLALVGDPVDNISGVRGIGGKSAERLFAHYEDLEALFADLDGIPELGLRGSARIQRLLAEGREQAFRARELTRLQDQAPLPFDTLPGTPTSVDMAGLLQLDADIGLGARNLAKLKRLHGGSLA